MKITTQSKLIEIKKAFSTHYPGLKIEFFIDKNKDGNLTADEKYTNAESLLSEISSHTHNTLDMSQYTTAADLENAFKEHFAVMVQVFRKSWSTWLMTSASDSIALSELSIQALQSTKPSEGEAPLDAMDRMELE